MRIFKFGSAALVLVSIATASFAAEHQQNQVKETNHSEHKVKKVKQRENSAGSSGGSVDRYEAEPMPRPRCINPANGMPMIDTSGGCGGFDVTGKPYGMR